MMRSGETTYLNTIFTLPRIGRGAKNAVQTPQHIGRKHVFLENFLAYLFTAVLVSPAHQITSGNKTCGIASHITL